VSEEKKKRRFGFKRWIILGLIAIGIWASFMGPSILRPISPVVALPAEPIWPGAWITNTILATLITDVLLILMAIGATRFARSGKLVPTGFYNFFEVLVEFLWNAVQSSTGKWARKVFPWVATIFLLVFVANMVKLTPGFESLGYLKQVHKGTGYAPVELFHLGIYTIDKGQPVEIEASSSEGEQSSEGGHGEGSAELCTACEVVPFLRGSATDLNFPLSLALIAVFMTQVFGVMALGPGYFEKFFQFRALVSSNPFGLIDFIVGFLELILEFAKIISFSFRLFGNIFAGALLLSIIGALFPVVFPPGLYVLEIFFGTIQAYVFFLLATVFISMGLVSHHSNEHG
jgi:F-type H+-transporting ATPase subunit a